MSTEPPTKRVKQSGGSMQFQVLKTATQIKLRELNAHEHKLRVHYAALLEAATISADDNGATRERLQTLYDGVKELQIVQTKLHPGLKEVGALVDFAASDPWTTKQSVALRQSQLLREIRERRSLWRHNKLLGALLHESLQEETNAVARGSDGDADWEALTSEAEPTSDSADAAADAKGVAKMTKEQTQAQLETYFFTRASGVTQAEVYKYLETSVFHRRDRFSQEQWERVRDTLSRVRETLGELMTDEVKQAITLLLRDSSSLNDDVVAFLTDVVGNEKTQQAHVLTIELANLHEFTWPEEDGVPVHFKRGMNGRFRCHLQEEAVPLLLFQYVGMKWGTALRVNGTSLLKALDTDQCLPSPSVEATRRQLRDVFTLAALDHSKPGYDDDGHAAETPSKLASASKQDVLRLLCAEARYHHVFQASEASEASTVTAVTTDLEFFGPSVAHDAVQACLEFFGVDDKARDVFARYMAIPLVFPGASGGPRKMQRGLSVGRAMTLFLSELLLFVMDFAVKASTGSVHLFRRHDDIIFYDRDQQKVLLAWDEMNKWATVAGLRFNADKSGSVCLQWSPPSSSASQPAARQMQFGPAPLPQTPIQWGLLELQSDASVRIMQDQVDAFSTELADRLQAATSVFGWINVYNKYMAFFLRNFGNVSPVFGLAHLDEMLATLQRVHKKIFSTKDGDVVTALRDRINASVQGHLILEEQIPAAWTQWPLELGGLGLFNPFLAIWSLKFAMRKKYLKTFHTRVNEPWPKDKATWPWREPFTTIKELLVSQYMVFNERVYHEGLKAVYPNENVRNLFLFTKSDKIPDAARKYGTIHHKYDDSFKMRSLNEYLALVASSHQQVLQQEYEACLMQVSECDPPPSQSITTTVAVAAGEAQLSGDAQKAYFKWVSMVFSAQIMDEFGTVSFFSKELLPAQLIATIKHSSVAW